MALHGDEATAVANGDARAGAFGVDGDGHLMLLSPTVKVGGDHCSSTVHPLFPHCYNYHQSYVFALLYVDTCR